MRLIQSSGLILFVLSATAQSDQIVPNGEFSLGDAAFLREHGYANSFFVETDSVPHWKIMDASESDMGKATVRLCTDERMYPSQQTLGHYQDTSSLLVAVPEKPSLYFVTNPIPQYKGAPTMLISELATCLEPRKRYALSASIYVPDGFETSEFPGVDIWLFEDLKSCYSVIGTMTQPPEAVSTPGVVYATQSEQNFPLGASLGSRGKWVRTRRLLSVQVEKCVLAIGMLGRETLNALDAPRACFIDDVRIEEVGKDQ